MNDKTTCRAVEVYTTDRYLFQKIRLAAPEGILVAHGRCEAENPLRLVDVDTVAQLPDGEFIRISRTEDDADIKIPFSIESLCDLLLKTEDASPLTVSAQERCAYLRGEKIRLTEVEYNLMSNLYSAGGEYVSREKLLREVWGKEADPGVLNVYVHYLREKLEGGGEKIILSSRKCGYKISEKYIGGGRFQNA